jgi:DNA-binding transcriptional MerR regulator
MDIALTLHELATAVGLSPARVARLVQRGLIESSGAEPYAFTAATAARLRRMLRLRRDLGVNLHGAAIIADLVERMEALERELVRRDPEHTSQRNLEVTGIWIRTD